MEQFNDKLAVQKITYLAQEEGIDLGYEFQWYIRGPYCKQVSEDAHTAINNNSTESSNNVDLKQIKEFGEKFNPYLNDTDWLEIAASILYLKNKNYADDKLDKIIDYLLEDLTYGYKNFDENLVRKVLSDMIELRIITA